MRELKGDLEVRGDGLEGPPAAATGDVQSLQS